MKTRRHGFTILELMIAVAIMGIVAAMTINGLSGLSRRSAPSNASQDLYSQLSSAHLQAVARGQDVWFIVYPELAREGTDPGAGAYFTYLDPTGGLLANGYADFAPDNLSPIAEGRLLEQVYLDDYSGKNVVFGAKANSSVPAPYGFDLTSGCSFCTTDGGANRGAIVFSGNGTARFFDGDGTPVLALASGANSAAKRSQYLSLKGREHPVGYGIVVNGTTSSISLFPQD